MDIKVLGTGCPNCQRLERVAREAILDMGVEATLSKVTKWEQILAYDVYATPALVINGKVVSSGRIPAKSEVASMLATALTEEEV